VKVFATPSPDWQGVLILVGGLLFTVLRLFLFVLGLGSKQHSSSVSS